MSNRMELPDDMQHLIEKREAERRGCAPEDASSSVNEPTDADRRKEGRRKSDREEC